ncbi:MAG: histidinol-phosphate transaminase [Sphingomonadales bacterium]
MLMGPKPNPWIDALDPYVPGRHKAEGNVAAIKMSANETPFGPSPKAVAAFTQAARDMHIYPEGSSAALRAALAEHHGIDADRIICGAGSDDILALAAQAFAGPGEEVIYVRHGFMIYPIVARRAGALAVAAPDRDMRTDVDAILASVTDRTRLVFIANPNNPTGTYATADEVARLHRELPSHVLLVLDEAYGEYVGAADYPDGIGLAGEAANVLVTRTFSKIYGLAAARVGWGYGAPGVIDALNRARMPFNVAGPAQAAAIAALADHDWTARARAHNDLWLPRLTQAVRDMGLEVVPSAGNFILIRFPETHGVCAAACDAYLSRRGYLLRHLPKQGLPDCLRLTIGLDADNQGVLAAMADFLREAGR